MSRLFYAMAVVTFLAACATSTPFSGSMSGDAVRPYVMQSGKPKPFKYVGLSGPGGSIAVGPNGDLWSVNGSAVVSRSTIAGAYSTYTIPPISGNADPSAYRITAGPDGDMWFSDDGGTGYVGRIDPAGNVTEFPLPGSSHPQGIVAGPDGALWVTVWDQFLTHPDRIDRVTTAGVITEFALSDNAGPEGITVGPDANLWFTEVNNSFGTPAMVGRITPSGAITLFSTHFNDAQLWEIETGLGHHLWCTDKTGRVFVMSTSGDVLTGYVPVFPDPPGSVYGETKGPDGKMWFSGFDRSDEYIMRLVIMKSNPPKWQMFFQGQYDSPPAFEVTAASDGNIWFPGFGIYVRLEMTPSPAKMTFQLAGQSQTLAMAEKNYNGTWTVTSQDPSIATVAPGQNASTFTVTSVAPGNTTVTIQDSAFNSVSVPISVL